MLTVGLTGELGSGKTTVARMLAERGAVVLSSDDMARAMMEPGEPVYVQMIRRFGLGILTEDARLNRRELARLAFEEGRVEELNAIVHPAVLAEQARRLAELEQRQPEAIAVVESALIFSTVHAGEGRTWRDRFDCVVLVTAPEDVAIARFVRRAEGERVVSDREHASIEADARRRLAEQRMHPAPEAECLVIRNDGDLGALSNRVDDVWRELRRRNRQV